MADLLATAYTVVVVLGAAVGTAGVFWVTDAPRGDRPYASAATALAVVVFVVALGASLL